MLPCALTVYSKKKEQDTHTHTLNTKEMYDVYGISVFVKCLEINYRMVLYYKIQRVDGANVVQSGCACVCVCVCALLELVCGKVAKIMGHIAHYNIQHSYLIIKYRHFGLINIL